MNIDHEIDILIGKFVSGNAGAEETAKLEEWKSLSKNNRQIFNQSMKAWEKSKNWISNETINQDKSIIQAEINKQLLFRIQKIKQQSFIYRIAALMAIPLAFAISLYFIRVTEKPGHSPQYCQVTAPKGHVAKCILPDQSEVWINSGSTIRYNIHDFNRKKREIMLEGEAFLQVSKNKDRPFTVITSMADVKVTGTSFNVKSVTGSAFETVLAEGSVDLLIKDDTRQTIKLKPGEKAFYDLSEKKLIINKVYTEIYSCWRNSEIIFKDATLNDLIKELERIYDIQFRLSDQNLGKFRFRGMFGYNNNLIDALEKIKKTTDIDYRIENKEVLLIRK